MPARYRRTSVRTFSIKSLPASGIRWRSGRQRSGNRSGKRGRLTDSSTPQAARSTKDRMEEPQPTKQSRPLALRIGFLAGSLLLVTGTQFGIRDPTACPSTALRMRYWDLDRARKRTAGALRGDRFTFRNGRG
jgi:hypothetical protein